jgi:hypothetical protein
MEVALVGLGHLGGGVVDRLIGLADSLLDLASGTSAFPAR